MAATIQPSGASGFHDRDSLECALPETMHELSIIYELNQLYSVLGWVNIFFHPVSFRKGMLSLPQNILI